jgi:hypothetical protein
MEPNVIAQCTNSSSSSLSVSKKMRLHPKSAVPVMLESQRLPRKQPYLAIRCCQTWQPTWLHILFWFLAAGGYLGFSFVLC